MVNDKEIIIQQLKKVVHDNLSNLWDDENFRQYYEEGIPEEEGHLKN